MSLIEEERENQPAAYKFPFQKFLSKEEERELAIDYLENGTADSAHTLVMSYLPALVGIASQYANMHGLPVRDLVQEGVIGLLLALRSFDPYKGFRFFTYAAFTARRQMTEYIMHNRSLVKIGTTSSQRALFFKVVQLSKPSEAPKEAEIEELAKLVKITPKEVVNFALRCKQSDLSLEAPIVNDPEFSDYMDFILDFSMEPGRIVEEHLLCNYQKVKVREALNKLSERERFIIEKHYIEEPTWTLNDIGKHYGVSRERIRQIESRAIRQLKRDLMEYEEALLAA